MKRRKFLQSIFLFSFFCYVTVTGMAANYYVDPSYTGGSSNGGFATPWKNLASVNSNMWAFTGGDTIFFKRGEHFSGTLNIYVSGTAASPVVFMPYGSGAAPVFEYSLPDASTPINRSIIAISNNRYVVVDGFTLIDSTINDSNHSSTANVGRGAYIYLGKHITLKNLYIERVGIGVTVQGDSNLVQRCTITNLREVVNTASPSNDDYGAVGILISGSYNNILNNTITECWAPSFDYTCDGGALELTGGASENQVLYNKAVNNDGWTQIDTDWSTQTESNNLMAYNLLINNGRIFWFNFGGTLTVQGFKFYNNDIIETVMQHSFYPYMIGCDAAPSNANALLIRNNIFWINTSIGLTYTVTRPFSGPQMVHQNNLYHMSGGSLGYSADASETMLSAGTAVFTNTSPADPDQWNYRIPAGSPAVDYGQPLSLTKDYVATNVYDGAAPEAGILETVFSPALAGNNFIFNVQKIGQNNVLQWSLQSDSDPFLFVVEKSDDGRNYYAIANIQSSENISHQYTDVNGTSNRSYYRIAAKFTNSKTLYSRSVAVGPSKNGGFTIFPNPAGRAFMLSSTNCDLYNSVITFFTAAGYPVKQITLNEHGNKTEVSLTGLPKGLYYLELNNAINGFQYSSTIIKN